MRAKEDRITAVLVYRPHHTHIASNRIVRLEHSRLLFRGPRKHFVESLTCFDPPSHSYHPTHNIRTGSQTHHMHNPASAYRIIAQNIVQPLRRLSDFFFSTTGRVRIMRCLLKLCVEEGPSHLRNVRRRQSHQCRSRWASYSCPFLSAGRSTCMVLYSRPVWE